MDKKDFIEKYGVHPSEFFGSNKPTVTQNTTKKPVKRKTGTRTPKTPKTPTQLKYDALSEDEHQQTFLKWLDAKKIYYEVSINGIFLPNPHPKGSRAYMLQTKVNRGVVQKQKKMGFKKGVADIKVYLPNIELNIELKKIGGKPTPEQLENVERYKQYQYATYVVIEGCKDAIAYVEKYI